MAEEYWARRCSARRTNGLPCTHWAMRGGWVCQTHGGRAPQVRAAAERRWQHELRYRAVESAYEREHGEPMPEILVYYLRYRASADLATWRRHRAVARDG
jgi:hypothetical protein